MARSTYIYVIMSKWYHHVEDETNDSVDTCEEDCILKTFTVKYEMADWLKQRKGAKWFSSCSIFRCYDGDFKNTITKMDLEELLK